jgi:diguanylate cyclase
VVCNGQAKTDTIEQGGAYMDDKKSVDESHNYVRLAIPLMSKHNISVTPKNFAIWYEYVSGNNSELSNTIDTMLEKKEIFSEGKNESLYRRFCAEKDENELRKLKEDLQKVLISVISEVSDLNGQTEKYEILISKSVDQLSEDASTEKIKNVVGEIIDETKSMGNFGKSLQDKLKETTEELEALQKEFEQAKTASMIDFLTGVANRKAFDETLAKHISEASPDNNDLCLLLIDIDHFKKFNDEYGHIVGDEVLKFVTKKTKEIVRGRDFLARFGGEEFVIILPQTPLSGAKIVAENIRSFFSESKLTSVTTSKKLGKVTVSIGAALYRPGEPVETFINRSDQALYFAKNNGRNRVATESDLPDEGAGG